MPAPISQPFFTSVYRMTPGGAWAVQAKRFAIGACEYVRRRLVWTPSGRRRPYFLGYFRANCRVAFRFILWADLCDGLRRAFNCRIQLPLLPFIMAYGLVNGMKVGIDKAGRIVVPKPLRERLGFKPDTELEAIEQPEGVLLKRVVQRPSMVRVDGLWVHQGSAELTANWERVLEEAREERIEVRFESVARWKFSSITTVLVAASEQSHPHYAQAKPAMLRVAAGQERDLLACTRSRRCQ